MKTLDRNLLDELGTWPESLYILHASNGTYACYCYEGTHGLMTFEMERIAQIWARGFAAELGIALTIQQVSFDEARRIAKNRPLPLSALILADDIENPLIHFVR